MKGKTYIVLGVFYALMCFLCLFFAFAPIDENDSVNDIDGIKVNEEKREISSEVISQSSEKNEIKSTSTNNTQNTDNKKEKVLQIKKYKSPINFELLQNENPDIYAWLFIDGTEADCPILQREGDNSYYLTHDSLGKPQKAGAIYTESEYNSRDFTDPVTVIYGHRMNSGARFGKLEEAYCEKEEFNKHKNIVIYLPDKELHYEVFAAVPYGNRHIFNEFDFNEKEEYDRFLQNIFSLQGVFDENITVNSRDKVIVLSTCLKWNINRRYLVLAKQTEIIKDEEYYISEE